VEGPKSPGVSGFLHVSEINFLLNLKTFRNFCINLLSVWL